MTARRLPAFAKPLAKARAMGLRPESNTVRIRLDSWPTRDLPARVHIPTLVVPPDAAPEDLDFSPLRDLEIFLHAWRSLTPPERVSAVLRGILAANPAVVILIQQDPQPGEPVATFIKSRGRGVEVAF